MLGKLIKYEFKATSRLLMPLLICMLAVGIIGGAVAAVQTRLIESGAPGIFDRFFKETDELLGYINNPGSYPDFGNYDYDYDYDDNYNYDADALPGFTAAKTSVESAKAGWQAILISVTFSFLMLLAFGLACGSVVCLILLGYRFYKNMFTDEGYLTFTLPVTVTQNLWAKLICGTLWQLIISAAMFLSLSMFFIFGVGLNPITNIANLSGLIGQIFRLFVSLPLEQTGTIWALIAETAVSIVLSVPAGLLMVYFAITLGCQIAQKHKIVASIGLYFALVVARSIISYILQIAVMFPTSAMNVMTPGTVFLLGMPGMILAVATILVCFLVSRNIMKNHLNLE